MLDLFVSGCCLTFLSAILVCVVVRFLLVFYITMCIIFHSSQKLTFVLKSTLPSLWVEKQLAVCVQTDQVDMFSQMNIFSLAFLLITFFYCMKVPKQAHSFLLCHHDDTILTAYYTCINRIKVRTYSMHIQMDHIDTRLLDHLWLQLGVNKSQKVVKWFLFKDKSSLEQVNEIFLQTLTESWLVS